MHRRFWQDELPVSDDDSDFRSIGEIASGLLQGLRARMEDRHMTVHRPEHFQRTPTPYQRVGQPIRKVTHHRGEEITTTTYRRGGVLHHWRGMSWAKTSKADVFELIDDFLDNPGNWSTCMICGNPVRNDEVMYAHDEDDQPCHEGGCLDAAYEWSNT